MWSCFEDLVIRKIMVKFKFNLNTCFNIYNFFSFEFECTWVMSSSLFCFACTESFVFMQDLITSLADLMHGLKVYALEKN